MEDPLNAALRLHRHGRLQDAGRIYQEILARDPDHPDALHLLGLLAHQTGRRERAAELILRSIRLRPDVPERHADLAEVWRALGRFDEARASCLAALRLRPDYPEALNNLGLSLHQGGDPAAAVARFRDALALRTDFAEAHNNLANALRDLGKEEAAVECCRRAVRCNPRLAEAHSNLGQLLCDRGRLEEALEHGREAIRLQPNFAEAHGNLGNILRASGRLDEARRHLFEAIRLNPRIGLFASNMALTLEDEGRSDDALSWHRRALALDGRSTRIRCRYARSLAERDLHDEAAALYEDVLRLDPESVEARNGLGIVRREQGRHGEAERHLRSALELRPEFAPAHCNLGVVYVERNDFLRAESCFRAALNRDPGNAGAMSHLAGLLRGALPGEDLAAAIGLLGSPIVNDDERAALHFGLAQALDGRGRYSEAAEHLERANTLALARSRRRGEAYEPARHAEFVSEMMAACSPAFFERVRGLGLDDERPVFIIGLPRSGTTLIEQILDGHPRAFGAGELMLGRESFEALPAVMGGDDPPTACLARLDGATIEAVGRRHLGRLAELSDAPRVVDKLPDNYLYLGMLAALFPKARIIHCRRGLRDTAVSCWMTDFRRIRWSNDPDHIASRFAAYRRLMDHWRDVLPTPMLDVAYEQTVADLEGVARRVVAWCDLAWDPACLEFHKSDRPVRTASATQVRRPLHSRSVARWTHYAPALGGLFAALEAIEPPAA